MDPLRVGDGVVTVRVTTLKGASAGEYYVHELPSYYLDVGEPRGVWLGQAAAELGLEGEVHDVAFLHVMAGADPRQPELLLGRRYGDDSVRGFDVTASAPKSVSVLKELSSPDVGRQVAGAHDAAVASMAGWIEANAHTRFRVNGEVVSVDAEGLVMATFRQHTSRALDPQLHTHLVVANRVRSPDGRWLALDARFLKKFQRTASAHYHLVLRGELTRRLGVGWEPVANGIAEMAHVPPGLLEEFSARTDHIARRLDLKLDRFVESMGREPTAREYWRLEREAVVDSRPAKAKNVNIDQLRDGWTIQAQTIGVDPAELVHDLADGVNPRTLTNEIAGEVVDQALVAVSGQSTWHPAELTREIAAAIPTDLVIPTDRITGTLDHLTRWASEHRCVDLSVPVGEVMPMRTDGRPITESPVQQLFTTPEILAQEHRLLAWADRRTGHHATDSPDAPGRSAVPLSLPQAEAAAVVAGDAHLSLIVGPAGTGKTTALSPAVEQLRAEGRVVFGVAPSANAADVLHRETGVEADTIDKLLTEHALDRGPDHRYDLPPHSTVIVDEAGMVGTDKLDQLAQLADERGWRVVLVGDPLQFAPVGRGGMFEHLTNTYPTIELDRVHRFTEPWEADASLRLRAGDQTVVDAYDQHGRVRGGTGTRIQTEALDAWEQHRRNGETVLLAAPDNDTTRQLNRAAQQRRIEAGELAGTGSTVSTSDYVLRVDDEIVTRRNDRQLETDRNQIVRNRDQWTIDSIHRNGDLTATGDSGTVRLPANYVKAHVELGYAQTSHATQGRTVDHSLLYLPGPTDARGIYVPMTRGRHSNTAYITTDPNNSANGIFAESMARNWIDQPAITRDQRAAEIEHALPGTLPPAELRSLIERGADLEDGMARNDQDLTGVPIRIRNIAESRASNQQSLDDHTGKLESAEALLAKYDKPLRRRGRETDLNNARHTVEQAPRTIERLNADIAKQTRDLGRANQDLALARNYQQQRPQLQTELASVNDRLDGDLDKRANALRATAPDRITDTIGKRPSTVDHGGTWDVAAGRLDQHQTAYRVTEGFGLASGHLAPSNGFASSLRKTQGAVEKLRNNVGLVQRPQHRIEGPGIGR